MMKIYTKSGDQGDTGLFGPGKVKKSDTRMEAIGTVDELNAAIGLLRSSLRSFEQQEFLSKNDDRLEDIQHVLFDLGAALADVREKPDQIGIESNLTSLETQIDEMENSLPDLKNFILPGGCPPASSAFWVRAVCRTAERRCVSHLLSLTPNGDGKTWNSTCQSGHSVQIQCENARQVVKFLNRLSDFFFVLGRAINHHQGVPDLKWKKMAGNGEKLS